MLPITSGGSLRRYGWPAMNRIEYSQSRIAELAARLSSVDEFLADEPLCVYATGSYGRLEARKDRTSTSFSLPTAIRAIGQYRLFGSSDSRRAWSS